MINMSHELAKAPAEEGFTARVRWNIEVSKYGEDIGLDLAVLLLLIQVII